ncbi:MAG TPA: hypothetical protein VIN09_13805 [Chloroflexota bacterium]
MPDGDAVRRLRVYEYGVPPAGPRQPPIVNRDLALEVMRRRLDLWNDLVALEHAHREQVERVLQSANPDLVALARSVEEAESDPERRDAERAYRAARRALLADPNVQEAVQALDEARRERARELARSSGLWWVNYEDVLTAYRLARSKPGQLRRRVFGREGKLLVRWQTGLPVERLLAGQDRRMRLQVLGARGRNQLARVWFRLTSDEGGEPVWLEMPLVLHRPLPAHGLLRQAAVVWKRVGTYEYWKVVCTVAVEAPPAARRAGQVVVRLGWKREPDGLRVATWRGSDGEEGALVLPSWWLASMEHLARLQSIRDHQHHAALAALQAWVETTPEVPAWLRDRALAQDSARGPTPLAALFRQWTECRFPGDEAEYQRLAAWAAKDEHLWNWQANLRDKRLRSRKDQYRVFAADLVRRYGTLVVEKPSLRRLARDKRLPGPLRRYRYLTALSELELALRHAAEREGATYLLLRPGTGEQAEADPSDAARQERTG